MQKLLTLFVFFLVFKTAVFAQTSGIVMGVLPIQKSPQLPPPVASMLENLIWEKVMAQQRFKIVKAGQDESQLVMLGTSGAIETGKKAGATHLVQFSILPYSFVESNIPKKFDQDFQVEMNARAEVEIKIMDVATGEIIELETLKGSQRVSEKVPKISPEKTVWSKEKGMHTLKKTEKEMQQEHRDILKKIDEWRRTAQEKAIQIAAEQTNDKFERALLPEIVVLEILEEKKEKAYKVVLTLVEGLDYNKKEYFKVKQTTYLEFNGEKVSRTEKIAGVKFIGFENGKAAFKVMSGKEEIYAAMQKGEKLICEYE